VIPISSIKRVKITRLSWSFYVCGQWEALISETQRIVYIYALAKRKCGNSEWVSECCSRTIIAVHVLLLLFMYYYCCSRTIIAVHVLLLLFMYYYCCSCTIIAVHVLLLLFTYYYCCSCTIIAVHVLLLLFMYYYCYSCISIAVHVLLLLFMYYYSLPQINWWIILYMWSMLHKFIFA
jgi:hypothetical protein